MTRARTLLLAASLAASSSLKLGARRPLGRRAAFSSFGGALLADALSGESLQGARADERGRMLTTLLSSKMLHMLQSLPPSAAQDEDLCGKLVDIRDQLQRVLRHQDARRAELAGEGVRPRYVAAAVSSLRRHTRARVHARAHQLSLTVLVV